MVQRKQDFGGIKRRQGSGKQGDKTKFEKARRGDWVLENLERKQGDRVRVS